MRQFDNTHKVSYAVNGRDKECMIRVTDYDTEVIGSYYAAGWVKAGARVMEIENISATEAQYVIKTVEEI